jgi:hypothetical protein
MFGFAFVTYGVFLTYGTRLFEVGYPPHPLVLEKRLEAVNIIGFYYPDVLKNEIEFLSKKIREIKLSNNLIKDNESVRYEKEFHTGSVNSKN